MNDIYVTVTGWVAKTPELRVTTDNTEWTTLRVGSTPRRRTAEGTWVDGVTQWFDVKVWGRFARNVATSVRGSDPVIVSGRMFTEEWETKDGTRSKLVINAQSIGHDLTRGTGSFTRVRYEAGAPVDVTGSEELADDAPPVADDADGPDGVDAPDAPDDAEVPEGTTGEGEADRELEPVF